MNDRDSCWRSQLRNMLTLWWTYIQLFEAPCVIEIGNIWARYGLSHLRCQTISHYRNQCWLIVNWTLRNEVQHNFNRNSNSFIGEKIDLKISFSNWRQSCVGFNVIIQSFFFSNWRQSCVGFNVIIQSKWTIHTCGVWRYTCLGRFPYHFE